MEHTYWHKQTASAPLYPDIAWSKPEMRSLSGKLAIVGGNKLGFSAVAEAYQTALETGVGQAKVLLPDVLKKNVPPAIVDALFASSNPSGGFSKDAYHDLRALGEWADGILFVGDAGRNSETAVLFEQFIGEYDRPLTLTRDAIDLVKNNPKLLIERPNTLVVASFAQVQKLFQGVYYPKMLTFSMQLTQLVENLHKFTITYPITIATFHNENLVIAHGGEVTTTKWENPMEIWRGIVATRCACYWLWNTLLPLESTTASLLLETN